MDLPTVLMDTVDGSSNSIVMSIIEDQSVDGYNISVGFVV